LKVGKKKSDMSETTLLYIFSAIAICIAAATGLAINIAQRLTRIETWMEIIGMKTAKILHSDGDVLGIDAYLDKYLKQSQKLSYKDWTSLKIACEKVESNPKVHEGKRLMAGFVAAVAIHNMQKLL
jgi:hypothetical protein